MLARFAKAQARLHRICADRLADSIGSFQSPGCQPVHDLKLLIDRNLQYAGADGTFMTDAIGITFFCTDLKSADRGDVFEVGCERFLVERVIEDDGHAITVQTRAHT